MLRNQLIAAGGQVESSTVAENAWRVSGATALLRELRSATERFTCKTKRHNSSRKLLTSNQKNMCSICAPRPAAKLL